MSFEYAQAATTTESQKPKKVGLLEQIIAGTIFTFSLMGVFSPVEEYFDPVVGLNAHDALYAPPVSYNTSSAIHVVTLLILLCLSLANWRAMWREARTMLPLLALVCWSFASTLWSIDPANTLHRAFHTVDHVVFAAYLVARFGWREIVALLTRAYGVIVILSVGAVLLAPDLGISNLDGYHDAWRGAFTQKNTLGAVAEVGVLVSGYSFLIAANNRWIAAFVCAGQLLLLVMARSATSTISLVIALGVVVAAFALFVHQRPVVRLFALMTVLGGTVAGIILFMSYDSVNEMMGRSASMTGRSAIWQYVLETAKTRPWLGYGYGFWNTPSLPRSNIWTALDWPTPHAHNEWLDVTLQTGIIGLCIEIFCLALALIRAVRVSFVLGDGKGLFCGLMIAVLCVRSFSETTLTDPAIAGWTWMVIPFLTLAHMAKEKTSLPSHRVAPVTSYRVTPVRGHKS